MLLCPTCGSVLESLPGDDTRIDRYDRTNPRDWTGGWLGLLSFLSFIVFRLLPWVKRRRWCPHCRKRVDG